MTPVVFSFQSVLSKHNNASCMKDKAFTIHHVSINAVTKNSLSNHTHCLFISFVHAVFFSIFWRNQLHFTANRRTEHRNIIKLEWALGRVHTFAYHKIGHWIMNILALVANWIKIDRAMVKRIFWPFHDLDLWPDWSQNLIKCSPDNNPSSHQISCDSVWNFFCYANNTHTNK